MELGPSVGSVAVCDASRGGSDDARGSRALARVAGWLETRSSLCDAAGAQELEVEELATGSGSSGAAVDGGVINPAVIELLLLPATTEAASAVVEDVGVSGDDAAMRCDSAGAIAELAATAAASRASDASTSAELSAATPSSGGAEGR